MWQSLPAGVKGYRFTFSRGQDRVKGVERKSIANCCLWQKADLEISIIKQASLCPTPKVMKLTDVMISRKRRR